jgi:ankyrin repeat protein
MDIKTVRVAIGKRSMMASLMAVFALSATVALAGMNEDLIEAAKRGDLPVVKRLLAKGADVNAKTEVGGVRGIPKGVKSPARVNEDLIKASKRGDLPEVKRLLTKGADVNAKDNRGRTVLTAASDGGHREIQEMLIKVGAK